MKTLHLLKLKSVPIYRQLQIEEALLRTDMRNWCILNEGQDEAIIMGISGAPDKLLNLSLVKKDRMPVIKRFSGGGTVFVDKDTLFITFIANKELINIPLFPEPILRWTQSLYQIALQHPDFNLKENDYVLGEKKFAGNAQYIRKDRWLHHTSFLWDFCPKKMEYLLLPEKRPQYRRDRNHEEFLVHLKNHFPDKAFFFSKIIETISKKFPVKKVELSEIEDQLELPHRKSTRIIPLN